MMLHGRLRRARLREPPMVPMINVVFLLLLYFMLVGSLNEKQLGVMPPLSASQDAFRKSSMLLVSDAAGNIRLEQQAIRLSALADILRGSSIDLGQPPRLQFAADQDASSQVLHDVIAAARSAGVQEIEILTSLQKQ